VAEERPHLEVVPGGAEAEPRPDPPAASPPEAKQRGGRWAWVLGALLILALVAVGTQTRRVSDLNAEVAGLHAELGRVVTELAEAQGSLDAHREHLGQVRGAVAQLQELVSQEPGQPAPGIPGQPALGAAGEPTPGRPTAAQPGTVRSVTD